jgi:mono/diheme cytochrome c family protein
MRWMQLTAAAAGAVSLATGLALAQQTPGNASSGYGLAKTWCAGCHYIEPRELNARDAVPSFAGVAAMKSTTQLSLDAFLQTSHHNMPDWRLTRQQVDDVVAYILSLHPKSS